MTRKELQRMLTHQVRIEKRGRGAGGDMATLETHESVPAFVEYGRQTVTDKKGEKVVVAAIVFLAPEAPLDPEHEHYRITQTAPYTREAMQLVRVDPIDDPRNGKTHHLEVAVK